MTLRFIKSIFVTLSFERPLTVQNVKRAISTYEPCLTRHMLIYQIRMNFTTAHFRSM